MLQSKQRIISASGVNPSAVESGVPIRSYPQQNAELDGSQPLGFPGHEVVAQHLATPKTLREFKSDSELADHLNVSRMSIHRWKHDASVMRRALWLSMSNKISGELTVRAEWPEIVRKAVALAKSGNLSAMKLCAAIAWPSDCQVDEAISVESLFVTTEEQEPSKGDQ